MTQTLRVSSSAGRNGRRWWSRWTSRRWFACVLIAMVVLILAGAAVGAQFLAQTAAVSNHLNDRISPARTAVAQLGATLIGQETAVRGYLLSGNQQFLEPYDHGIVEQRAHLRGLTDLLAGQPAALADLVAVEQEAARWRSTSADPLIAARRAGDAAESAVLVAQSKAKFDAVRLRVGALEARLSGMREQARADLAHSRRVRDAVFAGLIGSLLLLVLLIAVLLRIAVLRPLAQLGAAARRVAGGDFNHRLEPGGPADLVRLGDDVEAMRRRLSDSLEASQHARALLEQQQTELRRSNADLEQFAYVASHDLQEPLRKVASFCQLLQRRYAGALDDRANQYIGFAVDGAARMQQLIQDLLAFSRIGRFYDADQPVDLNLVVDDVEQHRLAAAIAEAGARITRPRLPTVSGDVTLLTMLWQNLIGNAVKFRRPEHPPQLTITATEDDDTWTFGIQDNGIGIEPEYADKVFVIFQRLHPREAYPGTGIGLALCKKIVEHHGGTIRLDHTVRDGTRVVFTLPVMPPVAPPPSAVPASAGASGDRPGR